MQFRATISLALQILAFACCGDVVAQLTITDPATARGSVRQTSLSTSEGIVAARRDASSRSQIRVTVQYLLVDDATQAEIYKGLEGTDIKNSVHVPTTADPVALDAIPAPIESSLQIHSPSRITTCVLNRSDTALVLQKATDSISSDVSSAPSVMLLDGKDAEMNDVVQHPFVIDIQVDGRVIKPTVQAFDDGTRLRLQANLSDSTTTGEPTIRLACEIVTSRVVEVRTDQIFGVQDEPLTVHVPIQEVTTAFASEQLSEGQTLLVDPHVTKTKSVRSESGVPIIAKIPYVGRTFKNIAVADVEQHMIVLLQPSSIDKNTP